MIASDEARAAPAAGRRIDRQGGQVEPARQVDIVVLPGRGLVDPQAPAVIGDGQRVGVGGVGKAGGQIGGHAQAAGGEEASSV